MVFPAGLVAGVAKLIGSSHKSMMLYMSGVKFPRR